MKAVRFHAYGGPEVVAVEDAPMPVAGPDDVLIRVHAAAVNPVDWKIRAGYMQGFLKLPLPVTMGCDVAGTVESVGAHVESFRPGDAVYGFINLMRNGAFAEYAVAGANELGHKPKTLTFVQAAAVPVGALTAWQAIFEAGHLQAGETVLIHAATGGVGSMAVQLAHWKGATVYATASASKAELVKSLGADHVIDYKTTRFEEVVKDADLVFDTVGGDTQARSFGVLKNGGRLISIVGPPPAEEGQARKIEAAMIGVAPSANQLEEIARLIDSGTLRVLIDTVLPFAETPKALALSEQGRATGKIVVELIKD